MMTEIQKKLELELWEMVKAGEIIVYYPEGSRILTFRVRDESKDTEKQHSKGYPNGKTRHAHHL